LARGLRPVVYDVQPNPERWQRILGKRASEVTFVQGSLLDRDQLQKTCDEFQVTRLIHLAALLTPACQQDPWAGLQVNVVGSTALFEVARKSSHRIKGISYASSFAVYGPETDDGTADVTAADNRPPSFYGAFKMAVDLIAEQYWRHFQIASVGIRPHVVYGPERDQGLTAGPSLAARAAVRGEAYNIAYRGRVGYDYVEDVARAFVRAALETPPGLNLVDLPGQIASSEEFMQAIVDIIPESKSKLTVDGPSIPSNIPPQPNYINQLFPDWRTTSLAEGVRQTIEFYRSAK
jgi:UDP-glucose 4-epimerase